MNRILSFIRRRPYTPALALALLLLALNLLAAPQFLSWQHLPATLAIFAPIALVAFASTPSILSGGIDVSLGPLMTFVNCFFVAVLVPAGLGSVWTALPIGLLVGAAVGAINGVLITIVRLQPVVATMGTLFVLVGGSLVVAPRPASVSGDWIGTLGGSMAGIPGALLLIVPVALLWWGLTKTAFQRNLLAVGDDDVSAFGAGIGVTKVRIVAYTLGGIIAAAGGFALTALTRSAEPALATVYALIGIAAVVLGGTQLGGGRGGLFGSFLGATVIFLLQQLLTSWGVQSNFIRLAYGAVLVIGVVTSAMVLTQRRRTA
ncbi:MAG: ABC transporter permease [Gulosibacter sp.]|uniref:ABC transporter permease n=1 Tax=Gulosibacter sp. TaxID=2817531 RepID=UPI003F907573